MGTPRRYILLFLILIGSLTIFMFFILKYDPEFYIFHQRPMKQIDNDTRILLYWTPFLRGIDHTRICGDQKTQCLITDNRLFRNHSNLHAYLFYGSSIDTSNFPMPREKEVWGLFHEESPKNMPFLSFHNAISMFNFTSTPSHFSDVPLTLQYVNDVDDITDIENFMQPVEAKTLYQRDHGLAPILYINSICDTLSLRDQYIVQLMKHIKVDSYGRCLHNKELPRKLFEHYLDSVDSNLFYKFIARYKFIIAYENAACDDYITEKLWRAIKVGTIPIYFGAKNIRKWLPHPDAAIIVDDYPNPKALADYIRRVNYNDNLYWHHLRHKYDKDEPVSNQMLLHRIYHEYYISSNHQSDFECFVCTYDQIIQNTPKNANQKHYDCGRLRYPKGIKPNKKDGLRSWFYYGKCEAHALNHFMKINKKYTKNELDTKIKEIMLSETGC